MIQRREKVLALNSCCKSVWHVSGNRKVMATVAGYQYKAYLIKMSFCFLSKYSPCIGVHFFRLIIQSGKVWVFFFCFFFFFFSKTYKFILYYLRPCFFRTFFWLYCLYIGKIHNPMHYASLNDDRAYIPLIQGFNQNSQGERSRL